MCYTEKEVQLLIQPQKNYNYTAKQISPRIIIKSSSMDVQKPKN